MTRKLNAVAENGSEKAPPGKGLVGSQTLLRGLDVLEAVASGATNLAMLSEVLGRLAEARIEILPMREAVKTAIG